MSNARVAGSRCRPHASPLALGASGTGIPTLARNLTERLRGLAAGPMGGPSLPLRVHSSDVGGGDTLEPEAVPYAFVDDAAEFLNEGDASIAGS